MSAHPSWLILGILLLAAGALVSLILALLRAEDGCEDEHGFHRVADGDKPTRLRRKWRAAGIDFSAPRPEVTWSEAVRLGLISDQPTGLAFLRVLPDQASFLAPFSRRENRGQRLEPLTWPQPFRRAGYPEDSGFPRRW